MLSSITTTITTPTESSPCTTSNNSDEQQYLDLISFVLNKGTFRGDRTGTGCHSYFAPPAMRFNLLDNTLPLLTTKRVPVRHMFEELMWFIRGQTDANILKEKGISIWDGNASREFLDSVGLTQNRDGDLGSVYGFQWRHFGANYVGVEGDVVNAAATSGGSKPIDYSGQGIDQVREIISKIRNNPTDRRIILSAWNPADLSKMALPPCHLLAQFYVTLGEEGTQPKLSCQLYQRSADIGLGVPFNIASYALFTILLAHATGCEPFEFIHTLGDAHVYSNHVETLKTQVDRQPRPFPKVFLKNTTTDGMTWREKRETRSVDDMLNELTSFTYENLEIQGYLPMGKLSMKMAV